MHRIHRWTSGLFCRFDDLLLRVENHEGLAAQALSDMRTSLARARSQLSRVDRDTRRLNEELRSTQASASTWKTRAHHETEEKKALECLRRSRQAREKAAALQERYDEQARMRKKVHGTICDLENKYRALQGKKQLLSTRQAAAQAADAVRCESGTCIEVEDVFDRWEIRLSETEFTAASDDPQGDEFTETYSTQEENESLLAELQDLKKETL